MTSGAAQRFAQALNNTQPKAQMVTDPVAIELMQKLEHRGMGKYLPDPEPVDERRQALRELAEWNRNLPQLEADREAQRQAEAETAHVQSMSTAQLLAQALNQANHSQFYDRMDSGSSTIPLNGIGVINAVVNGLGGQGVTRSG